VPSRRSFVGRAGAAALVSLGAGCRAGRLFHPPSLAADGGPFVVPDGERVDLVGHVLGRCTYGARPGDRKRLLGLGDTPREAVLAWLEAQLRPDRVPDEEVAHRLRAFESLGWPVGDLYEFRKPRLLEDLTRATLLRAVFSTRQLLEVMVELWSDHFNIDMSKGECAWLKPADDRDVVRAHALGRFGDLLRASALSPAMLWYLDGRSNRRRSPLERPNENYARELLELHTLGVDGGYTQRDVMEIARCLTGFTVRPRDGFGKGRVEFQPELHDDQEKVVLGHRVPAGLGRGDVDRVLDLLATHPRTAHHIASKLCRRFVADPPDAATVDEVARAFLGSGGSLADTLRTLLTSEAFIGEGEASLSRRATLVKRPFHFVVSTLRATDAATDLGTPLLRALVAMGQAPFQCPTPDGYPLGPEAWAAGLPWRFRLAGRLAEGGVEGTSVDAEELARRAGGEGELAAHVLGRRPTAQEGALLADAREGGGSRAVLALLLASPAFQRY